MLKKMLVHGLIAAAVIGGAAAVYAAGSGDGDAMDNATSALGAETVARKDGSNSYIASTAESPDRKRSFRGEHEGEHQHKYRSEGTEHRREHGNRDDD